MSETEPPRIHGGQATLTSRTLVMGEEGRQLRAEHLALRTAEDLHKRGYRLLDLERLEKAGRFVVDTQTHELWLHEEGEPKTGRPTGRSSSTPSSERLRSSRSRASPPSSSRPNS
jgi:hypothetical protein